MTNGTREGCCTGRKKTRARQRHPQHKEHITRFSIALTTRNRQRNAQRTRCHVEVDDAAAAKASPTHTNEGAPTTLPCVAATEAAPTNADEGATTVLRWVEIGLPNAAAAKTAPMIPLPASALLPHCGGWLCCCCCCCC